MRFIDASLDTLARNVALDEVLLERWAGETEPCLRLWANPRPAVAIGKAEHIRAVLKPAAFDGVEIVRRFTGGGSVVVGPDSPCITLILPHRALKPVTIYDAFEKFQSTVADALASLGIRATFEPPSDLAVDGRKVSGCAQARRLAVTAVHSTLLVECDIAAMDRLLAMPPRQPAYRQDRAHGDFVAPLTRFRHGLTVPDLRSAVLGAFERAFGAPATPLPLSPALRRDASERAAARYETPAWTMRW